MLIQEILSLRQQILIIEQRLRGQSSRGCTFLEDGKLILILKSLGQTLRTKQDYTALYSMHRLVSDFLANNQYKMAPFSPKQLSVFEYCDGYVLQMAKQAHISKQIYQELVLFKIPFVIGLLTECEQQNSLLVEMRHYLEVFIRATSGWTVNSGARSDAYKNAILKNSIQLSNIHPLTVEKINQQKESLLDIINEYFQQTRKIEQRLVEGLSKRIISHQASYQVDFLYNQQFSTKKFSKYFIVLMEQFWRKYLLSIFLRDGSESAAWDEAASLTAELSICWNLASVVSEKRKQNSLHLMQAALNKVHVDSKQLLNFITKMQKQPSVEDIIKIQKRDFKHVAEYQTNISELSTSVKKLRVGEWIFFRKESQNIRAKLIYKNLLENRFVFTNLDGQEVLDIDGYELTRWLKKSKVQFISMLVNSDDCDTAILASSKQRELRVHELFQHAKQKLAEEKNYLLSVSDQRSNGQSASAQHSTSQINGNTIPTLNEQLSKEDAQQMFHVKSLEISINKEEEERDALRENLNQRAEQERKAKAIERECERLNELKAGGWVEFEQDDGVLKLERLSFKLKQSKRLVFVNEIGIKTRELTAIELAEMLINGHANVHDWGNQFEQSLESVVNSQRIGRQSKDKPFR
jgi:hypothetical protein